MSLRREFDFTIDWPHDFALTFLDRIASAPVLDCVEAAKQHVAFLFPVASRLHGTTRWMLETATSDQGVNLLREIALAQLAADCFRAQSVIPLPRSRIARSHRWQTYESQIMSSACRAFGKALARWAILERIPVNWIPQEALFAELKTLLADDGFPGSVVEGKLVPPLPGGEKWLAEVSVDDQKKLLGDILVGPCSAVLYWQDRVAGAVIRSGPLGLEACAPELKDGARRLDFTPETGIKGLMLLERGPAAPSGWIQSTLRLFRLGGLYWNIVRTWRRWRQPATHEKH